MATADSEVQGTRKVATASADSAGRRLDQWLATVFAGDLSRSRLQSLIREGSLRLNGEPVLDPGRKVREGDLAELNVPDATPARPAGEAIPLTILHEDGDVIVIDKPAGLVVHPGAGNGDGTLVNALIHHCGGSLSGIGGVRRPGIVHRLDKGTSGVMVVAKNDAAHQELARQFHDREVDKEYVALVWGTVHNRKRIDIPIGRDPVHREKISTRARRARSAVTRVTWARALPGVTLIRVAIATGRTHQIRVHLNAIGHPIVGDALYGGVHKRVANDIRAVQRLTRPFLHAERLAFTHPRTGERMAFEAPLPDDLHTVLEEITPKDRRAGLFVETTDEPTDDRP